MLEVVLLSVLEGLTEFLPVSSTGHLILLKALLGWNDEGAKAFSIVIQLGAILAVVCLYPKQFLRLWPFGKSGALESGAKGLDGWRGVYIYALACAPAFILGPLLHKWIKSQLFHPLPVAGALIVGGVILLFVERLFGRPKIESLDQLTAGMALKIGLIQCLSMWPGVSRSAATIIGGLSVGLSKSVAAEFSFLIAVPVISAATLYELLKSWELLVGVDPTRLIVGLLVSFVVALVVIKSFILFLKRFSFAVFGWYRILLGLAVFWAMR